MSGIKNIIAKQRKFYDSNITKNIDFRIEKLSLLKRIITVHQDEIMNALKLDLNKSPFESYATEVGFILEELGYIIKHLRTWVKPRKVNTPFMHFPASSYRLKEPYGIVLIMAPWNYPFQLSIAPLIGAMAAGNCAIVKPAQYSSHTSAVIDRLIRENFDESYIAVIQGGRDVNKTLLEEKFDYIFFTGSVAVGKIVMEAASKYLTPVTLELGGKSPCIVDETADIDLTAKRIVWGKFLNAGQTCVAPDYILVNRKVKEELVRRMVYYIQLFYSKDPCSNDAYPKIINEKHFEKLIGLLQNESILSGGTYNRSTNQIAPTLIEHVTWNSPLMQEEIFGPLLPILDFRSLKEVFPLIKNNPKPLALYLFTKNAKAERLIVNNLTFGCGCINDTMIQLANPQLPFGGVGESGMGQYHGKASFDTFSHDKSVMKKSLRFDIPLRYPPFHNLELLKKIMK